MKIKLIDKNDLGNLYELNKLFGNDNSKENMKKHFEQNQNEIICIAYSDNIAVGYCAGLIIKSICYNTCRLDIEALFVKEEYRQKGIGNSLIKFMEKEALLKNIFHLHLITNQENAKAVKFYENLEYKKTGEILLDKNMDLNYENNIIEKLNV